MGWEFLFDDVGLDGDAEVVGLCGEVGGGVVVLAAFLLHVEGVVADVAPEDGDEAEGVGFFEGLGDFVDLSA